jgi:hypothetical protein
MIKDLRLKDGDLDLVAGKDIGMVDQLDAATTMVQTIIMGQDATFNHSIKGMLNRQSVRKLKPTEIAKLIKEEILFRIRKTNAAAAYFLSLDVNVSNNKDTIQIIVNYREKEQLLKTVEFIGDIFDGHLEMNFAEVVKRRW